MSYKKKKKNELIKLVCGKHWRMLVYDIDHCSRYVIDILYGVMLCKIIDLNLQFGKWKLKISHGTKGMTNERRDSIVFVEEKLSLVRKLGNIDLRVRLIASSIVLLSELNGNGKENNSNEVDT
ncbi:hypothetical protein QQP08_024529 [Theobroma cacao]|nr:hypothetical protein QQP08_024529 [Theobroma cacao]